MAEHLYSKIDVFFTSIKKICKQHRKNSNINWWFFFNFTKTKNKYRNNFGDSIKKPSKTISDIFNVFSSSPKNVPLISLGLHSIFLLFLFCSWKCKNSKFFQEYLQFYFCKNNPRKFSKDFPCHPSREMLRKFFIVLQKIVKNPRSISKETE